MSKRCNRLRPHVSRRKTPYRRRAVASGKGHSPFLPTETWHEPQGDHSLEYAVVVEEPGEGYEHVVTPQQIRQRLALLPDYMIGPLEVVQLAGMTRKKKTFPCYGMQWGSALYLYPVEIGRVEYFGRPPRPAERVEATMFGARWVEEDGLWQLVWSEAALRDYYLNNILIHELGHLLDTRNTSYHDRERYAEWFAIQYGYRPTQAQRRRRLGRKKHRRRHG